MELTLDEIKDFIHNRNIFERGEEYYKNNQVVSFEIDKTFSNDLIFIHATVKENSSYHEVNLSIDKTDYEIQAFHCDCAYDNPCKHVCAVLLKVYYENQAKAKKEALPVLKDEKLIRLIRDYEKNIVYTSLGMNVNQHIKITPILEIKENHIPALSFQLTSSKTYVVKSIETFVDDMLNHTTKVYGKELKLLHNIHSFEPDSQKWVNFILNHIEESRYIKENKNYNLSYDAKCLYLLPSSFDEYIHLSENDIYYRKQLKEIYTLDIQYNLPDLTLEINEYDKDNYEFNFLLKNYIYLTGYLNHYLIHDRSIYILNSTIHELVQPVFTCFKDVSESLKLHKTFMPTFYTNVLASIQSYIKVTGCDLKEYAPASLVSKLYLDMPAYDTLTAKLIYVYDDKEYPAFSNDAIDASRNINEEITTRVTLTRYMNKINMEKGYALIEHSQDSMYEFLTKGFEELSKRCIIYASDKLKRFEIRDNFKVSMGVKIENNLLEINFDTSSFPVDELENVLKAYHLHKKYYRMKDGNFVNIENSSLQELSGILDSLHVNPKELKENSIHVPTYRALYFDEKMKESSIIKIERDSYFKSIIKDIKNIKDSDFKVPLSLKPILRNYQKTGFRWLKTMSTYGFGGILADDMGIGKTIQVITLLEDEINSKLPSIVVAPSSLILNWESEIHKFSKNLNCLVVSGNIEERKNKIKYVNDYHVIITSYDYLKRDIEYYEDYTFNYHIIDEAQYIKNHTTKNALSVKEIKSKHKFALTGTPIENSLAELWSIFDFLMPGYLYDYNYFKKVYEIPIVRDKDSEVLKELKKMVEPFILRRIKKDVLKELPEKCESTILIEMDDEAKKIYMGNIQQMKNDLSKDKETNKIMILSMLTRLRQFCCHPSLIYDNYTGETSKLNACMQLVQNCIESKKKVLIFSQFTSLLSLIEKELVKENISYYKLVGSTPKQTRQQMVSSFNNDETTVFLISLKAGGTGLNLTSAEIVIHFDPWWNISAQNQATDRAYRMGQHNNVQVYQLIMKDTIEEKIQQLQSMKKELSDSILSENDGIIQNMSVDEILELL